MDDTYRIHFGYSRSKRYPHAVELAQLAHKHEVWGDGLDVWHVVTLTDEQANLMATLYPLAYRLPLRGVVFTDDQNEIIWVFKYTGNIFKPSDSLAIAQRVAEDIDNLHGESRYFTEALEKTISKEYLDQIVEDMFKVKDKLIRERRIDYYDDETNLPESPENPPYEPIKIYRKIRELINHEKYSKAVDAYYRSLGDEHHGVLTPELIYLKRLANIPLAGRDLLYFRTQSSREGLVTSNLDEYVDCIDETLKRLPKLNEKSPDEILIKYAPTMQQMIKERKLDWNDGVYLWEGKFSRDNSPVTVDTFTLDTCSEGRLFDRYPDQVRHCRIYLNSGESTHLGLWTTYSRSYYQNQILDKGLHLNGIEGYRHKSWRDDWDPPRREPDFSTIQSSDELAKSDYGIRGVEYTGRVHQIDDKEYYEISLFPATDETDQYENLFLELVRQILREAENLLRENHGIPRIGEGWISETELFWLVQGVFPDAQQHASPEWLGPQHLDVFVPSKKLAFEYQGRQHYEPIDFFGGQEAFESTIRRDKAKARKCKRNDVVLILWKYTEPIDNSTLETKLNMTGLTVPFKNS